MLKKITPLKLIIAHIFAGALAVAAYFGFRCPAQGCPACKVIGQ